MYVTHQNPPISQVEVQSPGASSLVSGHADAHDITDNICELKGISDEATILTRSLSHGCCTIKFKDKVMVFEYLIRQNSCSNNAQ
nr:hypothetical protein [Tanacetum cinerariifolium]